MKLYMDKAKLSDFGQICTISEGIYFGNDYLPHVYKFWVEEEELDSSKRRSFVLKDAEGKDPDRILGYQSFMFLVKTINGHRKKMLPVSYTHLTLPTIYSV